MMEFYKDMLTDEAYDYVKDYTIKQFKKRKNRNEGNSTKKHKK